MPETCLSCGELAVIEDDHMDGGVQRICIECGTVATGPKIKTGSSYTVSTTPASMPSSDVTTKQQICELCGDSYWSSSESDTKICPECRELTSDNARDDEPEALHESQVVSEAGVHSMACKSCGCRNLTLDVVGVDERLVCKDCGTVAGSEALMNDDFAAVSRSYKSNAPTLPLNSFQPKKVAGRVAGHEKINFVSSKLCFPDYIRQEAIEMFDQAFYKPKVIYTHISTKEHLAAACIFIVCRKHDIPVSLLHFRKYVDKFSVFLKGKKILLNCMSISLSHMTLSTQVEHLLVSKGFGSSVISKTQDILFLCRQAWLTQGRSREGLIIIAAYYAYISSDKCMSFISMTKFRQKFNFPKLSQVLQAECNNLLVKLASSIPWVSSKNIKSTTIYKYIDDILKYQNCLFHLTFKLEDTIRKPQQESEFGNKVVQEHGRKNKSSESIGTKHHEVVDKEALLPPVLKKVKQEVPLKETHVSTSIDLDSPELKDSEFDENEISSYLLSPEEEAQLRIPKLKFMES